MRRRNSGNTRTCVRVGNRSSSKGELTNVFLYLVVRLYHNACEQCQARFRRIAGTGSRPVSELSTVAGAAATGESTSNGSATNSPTQATRDRKRRQTSPSGSFTNEHGVAISRTLKRPRTSSIASPSNQHGTSHFSASEPGSVPHDVFSTKQQIEAYAGPSDLIVSTSPTEEKYFVKFHDIIVGMPTLQMKLERIWTHRRFINSVKFSPDGKYVAVGVADGRGFDSQRTYVYDATIGKKIWSVGILHIFAPS